MTIAVDMGRKATKTNKQTNKQTCCISSESHKTILTSGLECTLISGVTKILTQSVTSASFFKILVPPEKSISIWPFGDSDISALKNSIPNLYNNLPYRLSRNTFVLQQNNNMCSVGSNTVSWQRSHSLTHRQENMIPNIRTTFWMRE